MQEERRRFQDYQKNRLGHNTTISPRNIEFKDQFWAPSKRWNEDSIEWPKHQLQISQYNVIEMIKYVPKSSQKLWRKVKKVVLHCPRKEVQKSSDTMEFWFEQEDHSLLFKSS